MIGYAGLSHLGLVSSAAAAAKGFEVVAYDPDPSLCGALIAGRLPVVEPGLPELMSSVQSRLRITSDVAMLSMCDVVYISVDVPTDDDHGSDPGPVRRLVDMVAAVAQRGTTLVVLSQVRPGFTRQLRASLERRPAQDLTVLYQVETLAFGTAVDRALNPERFIVGCAEPARPLPPSLTEFLGAFGCPILPMRYESAELCKISINMFLASSLSTTNMLAEVCEAVGAEWREIAPALRLDRRIGQHAYLGAGLGIGGGNITRDMATIRELAREYGTDAQIVDAWTRQSAYQRDWALRALHRLVLGRMERPLIGLWGLAYKEHTQSTKNSPSLSLVRRLDGFSIRAFDPGVDARHVAGVQPAADALDACVAADALVVMTPWPQFREIDLVEVRRRMRGHVLVDPFGCLDAAVAAELGFEYARLGTGREKAVQASIAC